MSEQAIVLAERQPPALLRPIAAVGEIIRSHQEVAEVIQKALQAGIDFGPIPGTKDKKDVLFKAGAERICLSFGAYPVYEIVDSEVDHDRLVEYTKRNKVYHNAFKDDKSFHWDEEPGTSIGLYRYVVKCRLLLRGTGDCIGTGIGSCSTLEAKYIDRPRDLENTVLKMAEKRALVACTLNTFALSDRFTQDVDDFADGPEQGAARTRGAAATRNNQKPDSTTAAGVKAAENSLRKAFQDGGKPNDWIDRYCKEKITGQTPADRLRSFQSAERSFLASIAKAAANAEPIITVETSEPTTLLAAVQEKIAQASTPRPSTGAFDQLRRSFDQFCTGLTPEQAQEVWDTYVPPGDTVKAESFLDAVTRKEIDPRIEWQRLVASSDQGTGESS